MLPAFIKLPVPEITPLNSVADVAWVTISDFDPNVTSPRPERRPILAPAVLAEMSKMLPYPISTSTEVEIDPEFLRARVPFEIVVVPV